MTAQRQERYGRRTRRAFFALLAAFFASACLDLAALNSQALNSQALAATTERVVVNRYSGVAIEGFEAFLKALEPDADPSQHCEDLDEGVV